LAAEAPSLSSDDHESEAVAMGPLVPLSCP
jgi:hypothetical protein